MAKRRTKKDKVNAKHQFNVDIEKLASSDPNTPTVKGEKNSSLKPKINKSSTSKSAILMAKEVGLASIKKDIIKSLSLAVFILAIELMIYLFR